MRQSCSSDYQNTTVKSLCENHHIGEHSDNVKVMKPVTDLSSNITYANQYCAICTGVTKFQSWSIKFTCKKGGNKISSTDKNELKTVLKNMKFDHSTKTFRNSVDGVEYSEYSCVHSFVEPNKLLEFLRPCHPRVISTCSDVRDQKIVNQCKSFTKLVYTNLENNPEKKVYYKNKYCAACNGITQNLLDCREGIIVPYSGFALIFNSERDTLINMCDSLDKTIATEFC